MRKVTVIISYIVASFANMSWKLQLEIKQNNNKKYIYIVWFVNG